MRLSEEQYELIEAYLTNELSDADRRSLEEEMRTDVDLQDEVNRQRQLRLGLRAMGIQAALERARAQYQASQLTGDSVPIESPIFPHKTTLVRPLWNWRAWAAAACVVVALGIGYYTYQQGTSQREVLAYTDKYVPSQADALMKDFQMTTLTPTSRQQFLNALSKYKSGHYEEVIKRLRTLPTDQQTIHYKYYFLGLSHLANQQPSDAIFFLQKALVTPSIQLRQKVEWFLALAYVKNNQKQKALPTLKRISADKANPFQPLAQRILQKIS